MSKIITDEDYLKGCYESYERGKREGQKNITAFIRNILSTALAPDKKVQLIDDFTKAWEE